MKVLFISRIYPNEFNTDGRVIHSQAKELLKRNIEVKVIAPVPITPKWLKKKKELWSQYDNIPQKEVIDGIEVFRPKYVKFPKGILNTLMEISFVNTVMKTIKNELSNFNFDLLHCHMTYPDSLVLNKVKSYYNVPVIVSSRSSDLDLSMKDSKKRGSIKESYSKADLIISPSEQLRLKLQTSYNFKSEYIGNGIYPNELDDRLDYSLKSQYENKFIVLSASSLINRKRIEDNIKAISLLKDKIPNLLYVIIGDGPEKKKLIELVEGFELQNNVLFLGNLPHNQVMEYMKICDVFSLPSIRETFGLVYLEALYFNRPIILCEGEAIAASLNSNQNAIIVYRFKYKQIADAIFKLYSDKVYYQKVSNRGKEFVENNYTWDIIGNKLVEQYKSLVNTD